MKYLRSLGKMLVLSSVLLSVLQIAHAGQVQYTYTGETGGGVVMGIHTLDYNGGALVGEFNMTTSNPGFSPTLLTYCTDVGAFLSTTYNYTPTPLSAASGVSPAWISGGIQNVATLWSDDKTAARANGATGTAGLQLAIWELLYNKLAGSYSASTFSSAGNNGFYITTTDAGSLAVENYAADLLNNFDNLPADQDVEWLAPTAADGAITGSQGLLYQTPDAVSTLALLGMAVLALVVSSRKLSSRLA